MNLSIIIPVFNQFVFTKNAIENLLLTNAEIIIVDNNSSDETQQECLKLQDKIVYIRNDINKGFGAAVNQGFSKASYDNIMTLNNDVKFGNKESFLKFFNNLPEVIENNPNSLIGPTLGFVDPADNYNFKYETHFGSQTNKAHNYVSGWCLIASKETFKKLTLPGELGPFDSKTFFLYYEDTDLGLRSMREGILFHQIQCPLVHFGKQSSKLINTSKWYQESRKLFLKKWKIN